MPRLPAEIQIALDHKLVQAAGEILGHVPDERQTALDHLIPSVMHGLHIHELVLIRNGVVVRKNFDFYRVSTTSVGCVQSENERFFSLI